MRPPASASPYVFWMRCVIFVARCILGGVDRHSSPLSFSSSSFPPAADGPSPKPPHPPSLAAPGRRICRVAEAAASRTHVPAIVTAAAPPFFCAGRGGAAAMEECPSSTAARPGPRAPCAPRTNHHPSVRRHQQMPSNGAPRWNSWPPPAILNGGRQARTHMSAPRRGMNGMDGGACPPPSSRLMLPQRRRRQEQRHLSCSQSPPRGAIDRDRAAR